MLRLCLPFRRHSADRSSPSLSGIYGWNDHSYSWREIPIFKILDCRVVRFIPSRIAAPRGPAITPLVSRSTRIMYSRSRLSSVPSLSALSRISANSAKGALSTRPSERMTDRSIRFSSSRTLPGHCQFTNAFIVPLGIVSICLFNLRENFCTKCRTSSGISVFRSRSEGMRMGKTFRR